MTTKDEVRALMSSRPNWYAEDIAEKLDCTPGYVRATARRYQWRFKSRLQQPHTRIPTAWIEKNQRLGETMRETLDRIFNNGR